MKLICAFVLTYAKRWFSHDRAHDVVQLLIVSILVKIEKQTNSPADQFSDNKSKANVATIVVKPPRSGEDNLATSEEETQTEESQESDISDENAHEAEFTVEINDNLDVDFEVDFADGDESGLEEKMETDDNLDHTIDTNKTGKKMIINKLGNGKNTQLKVMDFQIPLKCCVSFKMFA